MTDLMAKRKDQAGIKSLGDLKRSGRVSGKIDPTKAVNGPDLMDCLVRPWQRGDMTGILAGTGVGKTSAVLYILKHILKNNPEGVVAFISLELVIDEVAEKWYKATEDEPELADRLFIVENFDEKGHCLNLTLPEINIELVKIKETLGTTLHAYALDHMREVNINGSMDYNPLCREIKNMTVALDSHGLILAQTTKGKGVGDIPVPKDGCYGTSAYENLMTNILSIFQPLKRVEKECGLAVMGWQYAKIRYKSKEDKCKEGMNYLMRFDFDNEDLIKLNTNELATFKMWYDKVLELRKNEEKFKSYQFDLSTEIIGKDGKVVKMNDTFGGGSPEDDEL